MKRFNEISKQRTATSIALMLAILVTSQIARGQERLAEDYRPLQTAAPETVSVDVRDEQFAYGGRKVPLRFYLPDSVALAPVVLISHGLGGTRKSCTYLGQHWASRGYAVVAMQHAGSDLEVIREAPRWKRMQVLKEATNASNAKARYADVKATIDFLEQQNETGGKYTGRFNLSKIGMSGHSFGAVTTQAVSGQNYAMMGQIHTDSRIDAACMMSPSPPTVGRNAGPFAKVAIPWILMTGTKDTSPVGRNGDAQSRREVFQGLPSSGHFYELVLHDAEHSAFGDSTRLKTNRNPNHYKVIKLLSTAFWDAYLKEDAAAQKWLDNSGAKNVLEPKDTWQRK